MAGETKYCPSCGSKNLKSASFCTNCGTKIETAAAHLVMHTGGAKSKASTSTMASRSGNASSRMRTTSSDSRMRSSVTRTTSSSGKVDTVQKNQKKKGKRSVALLLAVTLAFTAFGKPGFARSWFEKDPGPSSVVPESAVDPGWYHFDDTEELNADGFEDIDIFRPGVYPIPDVTVTYSEEDYKDVYREEAVITPEEPSVQLCGIQVNLGMGNLLESDKISVASLPDLKDPVTGNYLRSYEVRLESGTDSFISDIAIEIPIDEQDGMVLDALTFNEDTGRWESRYYEMNEAGTSCTIYTKHLCPSTLVMSDKELDDRRNRIYDEQMRKEKVAFLESMWQEKNAYLKYMENCFIEDPKMKNANRMKSKIVLDRDLFTGVGYDPSAFTVEELDAVFGKLSEAIQKRDYKETVKNVNYWAELGLGAAGTGNSVLETFGKVNTGLGFWFTQIDLMLLSIKLSKGFVARKSLDEILWNDVGDRLGTTSSAIGAYALFSETILPTIVATAGENAATWAACSVCPEVACLAGLFLFLATITNEGAKASAKYEKDYTRLLRYVYDKYYLESDIKVSGSKVIPKQLLSAAEEAAHAGKLKTGQLTFLKDMAIPLKETLEGGINWNAFLNAFMHACSVADPARTNKHLNDLFENIADQFWRLKEKERIAFETQCMVEYYGVSSTKSFSSSMRTEMDFQLQYDQQRGSKERPEVLQVISKKAKEKMIVNAYPMLTEFTEDLRRETTREFLKNVPVVVEPALNAMVTFRVNDLSVKDFADSVYAVNLYDLPENAQLKSGEVKNFGQAYCTMRFTDAQKEPLFYPRYYEPLKKRTVIQDGKPDFYYPFTGNFIPNYDPDDKNKVFECNVYHYILMGCPLNMQFCDPKNGAVENGASAVQVDPAGDKVEITVTVKSPEEIKQTIEESEKVDLCALEYEYNGSYVNLTGQTKEMLESMNGSTIQVSRDGHFEITGIPVSKAEEPHDGEIAGEKRHSEETRELSPVVIRGTFENGIVTELTCSTTYVHNKSITFYAESGTYTDSRIETYTFTYKKTKEDDKNIGYISTAIDEDSGLTYGLIRLYFEMSTNAEEKTIITHADGRVEERPSSVTRDGYGVINVEFLSKNPI